MIPLLGTSGEYIVTAPYSLKTDMAYTCRGVSYITALKAKGIDVFTEYYATVGLTETDYLADLDNDVAIITLLDQENETIDLPDSYITTLPGEKEIPYKRLGILLELGFFPESMVLDSLVTDFIEYTKEYTGVEPTATILQLPYVGFITSSQHATLEDAREANIKYNPSIAKALTDSDLINQGLRQRIVTLEDLIAELYP